MPTPFSATVPHHWLPRFIGHNIWFRPDGVGDCDWYELIDVCITNSQLKGWVIHAGQAKSGNLAQKTTVQDVPQDECVERIINDCKNTYQWWEWQPPHGKCPPDIPLRDTHWRPANHPITLSPASLSDDGALFTL
ncbi:hypothetical protein [Corynebacterium coyleae]|uniref:hypothetical protein n=1 Tax=Corynebacterium coyleae TaxID=53374 RepID=UPI002550263B|nr:hypothetical protein [Corynebacterium coyleae]MDK8242560.1 hypothetical protein [Corynebacterium coyleae]